MFSKLCSTSDTVDKDFKSRNAVKLASDSIFMTSWKLPLCSQNLSFSLTQDKSILWLHFNKVWNLATIYSVNFFLLFISSKTTMLALPQCKVFSTKCSHKFSHVHFKQDRMAQPQVSALWCYVQPFLSPFQAKHEQLVMAFLHARVLCHWMSELFFLYPNEENK